MKKFLLPLFICCAGFPPSSPIPPSPPRRVTVSSGDTVSCVLLVALVLVLAFSKLRLPQ